MENKNVIDYLNFYINKEDTSYATLLNGSWGCGKTFFIKTFINANENKKKNKCKFIYISLFGLKKIEDVNTKIFEELHPILSSKKVKFVGNILQTAVKLGIKIDLNADGKNDGNINLDLSKLSLFDESKYKNTIFIFDDLERTLIPISEILGFINSITDQSSLKVILIANEEELKEEEKNHFDKFKEKVINKTFTIKNDHNSYWLNFNKKYKDLIKNNEIVEIKDSFNQYGKNNFRMLNQIVDDYVDFKEKIKDEFLKNEDFSNLLIKYFFALSFTYKKNNDFEKTKEILKDSSFSQYQLLKAEDWQVIITDFYQDYEELNRKFSNLLFFRDEKTERPSWLVLWYYFEISPQEFEKAIKEVVSEFKEFKYSKLVVNMHVISLMIFFIKKGISIGIEIDEIENLSDKYIEKNLDNEDWGNNGREHYRNAFSYDFNGSGFAYINPSDRDFIKIKDKYKQATRDIHEKIKNRDLKLDLDKFFTIFDAPQFEKDVYDLLKKYRYIPIFNNCNWNVLKEKLTKNPQFLRILNSFLFYRYDESDMLNGQSLISHLSEELSFLMELKEFIDGLIKAKEEEQEKFLVLQLRENLGFIQAKIENFEKLKIN